MSLGFRISTLSQSPACIAPARAVGRRGNFFFLGLLLALVPVALGVPCATRDPTCIECAENGVSCALCTRGFVLTASGVCGWGCNASVDADGEPNPLYIPHAVLCDQDSPLRVVSCESGWSPDRYGSACIRCTSEGVDPRDNHCASCSADGKTCQACEYGWAGLDEFCGTPATCLSGAIPGCTRCDPLVPMRCAACSNGYRLSEGACLAQAVDPDSPGRVEHCVAPASGAPAACGACESGYGVKTDSSDDSTSCEPCLDATWYPNGLHCATCTISFFSSCSSCDFGWTSTSSFCDKEVDCMNGIQEIVGCSQCDSEYPGKCAACKTGFSLKDATCIPACRDPDSSQYVQHCTLCGSDTGSSSQYSTCRDCEPGYGLSSQSSTCIACKSGSDEEKDGQHCRNCTQGYFDQYPTCVACEEGWTGLDTFCSTAINCLLDAGRIPGCRACLDTDQMKCGECDDGFILSSDKTECNPRCIISGDDLEVLNCQTCGEDGETCAVCAEGYTVAGDRKSCVACEDPELGQVQSQHCSQCALRGASESDPLGTKIVCQFCQDGWYNASSFCNYTASCINGPNRIPNCVACDVVDGSKCGLCAQYYYLSPGGLLCEPACTSMHEDNAYRVEHCAACSTDPSKPRECAKCEVSYGLTADKLFCAAAGDCYPQIVGCSKCSGSSLTVCERCAEGYYLVSSSYYPPTGVCYAKCNGVEMPHCLLCSLSRPGNCVSCTPGYILHNNGSCVPSACFQAEGDELIECGWRGTCNLGTSQSSTPQCSCDLSSQNPSNYCSCRSGYTEVLGGDCVDSYESCSYPHEYCTTCLSTICSSCVEGYFGTDVMLCKQYWEGCDPSVSTTRNTDKCTRCLTGFESNAAAGGYNCVPSMTCQDDTMPNCAHCDKSGELPVCTRCRAGYSDLEGGCETPCEAGPNCLSCSPTDPTVCVECQRGMPPYCLPVGACESGYSLTLAGECVSDSCIYKDLTMFKGFYGGNAKLAGNSTCAEAGKCVQSDEGFACECDDPLRDPKARCAACVEGYTLRNGTCVGSSATCPQNCFACSASGACLSCVPGWTNRAKNCEDRCTEGGCSFCEEENPAICLLCREGYEISSSSSESAGVLICKPYCEADCTLFYGEDYSCVRAADGSSVCVKSSCAASSSLGAMSECSFNGKCVDGACVCSSLALYSTCSYCSSGLRDPSTGICAAEVSGCGYCSYSSTCVLVDGAAQCVVSTCVAGVGTGAKVCGGRGSCVDNNRCLCDDPLFDSSSACTACVAGYVLGAEGRCVEDRYACLRGSSKVAKCAACSEENPKLCSRCIGDYLVDRGGAACVICAGDLVLAEDKAHCECKDPSLSIDAAGKCTAFSCSGVTGCVTCMSSSPEKCAACGPAMRLAKDRLSCIPCGGDQVASADGFSCICEDGKEPAGDVPGRCIHPECRSGEEKVEHCLRCAADAPAQCGQCEPEFTLSSGRCECPDEMRPDVAGRCAVPRCLGALDEAESVAHCAKCSATDPQACAECALPYVVAAQGRKCTCAFGMHEADDGRCIVPRCLMEGGKVEHCVGCDPDSPSSCKFCEGGREAADGGSVCRCIPPTLEGPTGECYSPLCLLGETKVTACTACDPEAPDTCLGCVPPLTPSQDGLSCQGCGENMEPTDEGECVCVQGTVENVAGVCAAPRCITEAEIQHCARCAADSELLCGECGDGRVPVDGGVSCGCPAGQQEAEDGSCAGTECFSVTGCTLCSGADSRLCAGCRADMSLVPGPTPRCECLPGTEFASDGETCVRPLCREGEDAVEYCVQCAADSETCASCSHNRVVRANACVCNDNQEPAKDGTCVVPLCKTTSAIENCVMCDASDPNLCAECTNGHVPTDSGRSCACPTGTAVASDGTCKADICRAVAWCTTCLASDPSKCYACETGKSPNLAGDRCECDPGTELGSDGETCVQPYCHTGTSAIKFCTLCESQNSRVCAECSHGHVASGGKCACRADQEEGDDGTCITPRCKNALMIQYCTLCEGQRPEHCAACEKGHAVSQDGQACSCPADQDEGDTGDCIEPACLREVSGCEQCYTSSPALCARCETGMEPTSGGASCSCLSGTEFGDDGKTCVTPHCHTGQGAVPYCILCSSESPFTCAKCSNNRVVRGNSCVCPVGMELTDGDNCAEPRCKSGASQVENCLMCSDADTARCAACGMGMTALDNGERCACLETQVLTDSGCVDQNCTFGPTAVERCVECAEDPVSCALCEGGKEPDSSGLCPGSISGGAIAGIVVGVVVLVVALGLIAYFVVTRGRGKSRSLNATTLL